MATTRAQHRRANMSYVRLVSHHIETCADPALHDTDENMVSKRNAKHHVCDHSFSDIHCTLHGGFVVICCHLLASFKLVRNEPRAENTAVNALKERIHEHLLRVWQGHRDLEMHVLPSAVQPELTSYLCVKLVRRCVVNSPKPVLCVCVCLDACTTELYVMFCRP